MSVLYWSCCNELQSFDEVDVTIKCRLCSKELVRLFDVVDDMYKYEEKKVKK